MTEAEGIKKQRGAALTRSGIGFHRNILHRVGQCLECSDLHFRAVMKLRENVQTNVLVRIRHHACDRGDLFLGKCIHNLGNMMRRCRIHRMKPAEIRQNANPRGDVPQKLTDAFCGELRLLCRDVLRSADHEEAFRLVEFNRVHTL